MGKAAFNKYKFLFTSKLEFNLKKELFKSYLSSRAVERAETLTLWKVYLQFLESVELQRRRRVGKIIWNDPVKNEEVLQKVKEERNILHKIKERRTIWIDRKLLRNCLLKHAMEGQTEGTQERRRLK